MNTTAKVTTKVSTVCDREFVVKVDGKVAGRVFLSAIGWTAAGRFQGFSNNHGQDFDSAVAAVVSFL